MLDFPTVAMLTMEPPKALSLNVFLALFERRKYKAQSSENVQLAILPLLPSYPPLNSYPLTLTLFLIFL